MSDEYYEWDDAKNLANLAKYNVSFVEAEEAFDDPHRLVIRDKKHSENEPRFFCYGKTSRGIITVRFTMRGQKIRIIGAGYWRTGKKIYERRTNER